jgi:hypothetical protein
MIFKYQSNIEAEQFDASVVLFQTVVVLSQLWKKDSIIVAWKRILVKLSTDYQSLACCTGCDIKFLEKNALFSF